MPETLTARARWIALVVVCFGQFMVILDATIVNVALPSIQTDLHLSPENLQWIVNSYTLLFGGFLLLGGRAADLIGRRTVFMAGVVIFSAASLANALATTGTILIIARGENPYAGFNISLDHSSHFGRPAVTLHNIAPTFVSIPAQVCTPFMLTGTIDHCPRLAEVTIAVAGVERCIPVIQVGDIPRTW